MDPSDPFFARRPSPFARPARGGEEQTLSVAELDRRIKRALEGLGQRLWVEGEVSSFKAAASGHLYYTLKDEREDAAIDCVMYRSAAQRGRRYLENGARVQVRGKATLWAPRGRLQLVTDAARPAGRGALLEALERLRKRLEAEGLFRDEHKQPLPPEPRRIGVVTSRKGAAVFDIAKVAFQRGGANLLLSPALVQGANAAAQMVRALALLQRVPDVDVIIIGRGGGSSDDLSAFNDEALVRAAFACKTPLVSAVGHEVDITLLDRVADCRAATPSQAAELVVPNRVHRKKELASLAKRMTFALQRDLSEGALALSRLQKTLGDPRLLLASAGQRLDERSDGLERAFGRILQQQSAQLTQLERRLSGQHPAARLAQNRGQLQAFQARLSGLAASMLERQQGSLRSKAAQLSALSPLAVLERGYGLVRDAQGRSIQHATDVSIGDTLEIRLREGSLSATVTDRTIPKGPRSNGEIQ